ncbi:protoporphyrinogen/coproporphyrinogen oxidase [Myxococcota bacterium]
MSESTVILGGGLAGLSCAHHLGGDCLIIERESTVGGLARTFERHGFLFDCTGHWLHLTDDSIRSLVESLLEDDLLSIERRSEIHLEGQRTPYPFQANTFGRPAQLVAECVLGYFRAREAQIRDAHPPPETFTDFIRQKMGDGIADHFMIPYNTKLWTVHPSEMSHTWCGRFVPVPTPEEIVRGALEPNANRALGYNASFLYPRTGGIGRIAKRFSDELRAPVRCNVNGTGVNWRSRELSLNDGTTVPYHHLVSTIPLPDLVSMLDDPPETIVSAARALRAASVTYWDVGVLGANPPDSAHWVYFPERDIPFYRAGSASAAVPALAPPAHRSYYVEVSHPRGVSSPVTDRDILSGMRRVGLLDDEEPAVLHRSTIDCAYVIMDAAYGRSRATLLDWLGMQKILPTGRYGAWTYGSMEDAMIHGREAAAMAREAR